LAGRPSPAARTPDVVSDLTGEARAHYIRSMFGRIAGRYNLLNRLMTFGQDVRWRRIAVSQLDLPAAARALDIGAGTGDLAFEIDRQTPDARIVAADFTPEMLHTGRGRAKKHQPAWLVADALKLPLASGSFDGVISGFLLRNVVDLPRALGEQARVLRPGGRWVALETTPPPSGIMRPLIELQLRIVIPLLGRLIAGDPAAYRYLPRSTEGFVEPDRLADMIADAGFEQVGYRRFMFGTIAIHRAVRSQPG
jgi:demethylmenaquinone methyltransferase/2-methoxy-6-polyprenyl-1,4-benzoquinol methylase